MADADLSPQPRAIRRIGVVSGVREELAAFLPDQPRDHVDGAGITIQRVPLGEKNVYLACCGIGKVAAATAAAILHARCGVDLLMVVGTAAKVGRIDGEVFNITEAVQGDYGAQRPPGLVHYTAGTLPIGLAKVQAFEAMPLPGFELPRVRIATSDLFIECALHASGLNAKLGAHLIDMETAAVAQAAALLGLPWLAIKATTDSADGESAASFAENLHAAARASARAAEQALLQL